MSVPIITFSPRSLARLGLFVSDRIHYQSTPEEIVQDSLRLGEGSLTSTGALSIRTGKFTGRSPLDKFTVKDDITAATVDWNQYNIPIDEKFFHIVHQKLIDYFNQKEEIWIRDCFACADPAHRLPLRIPRSFTVHPAARQNLFQGFP